MKIGHGGGRVRGLFGTVILALIWMIGPATAKAEEGDFALSVATGTGFVLGSTQRTEAPGESFSMRHPFLLDFDLQYEVLGWLAVSAKAGVTVESGPVVRLLPSVVFDTDDLLGRVVEIYGRVGPSITLDPALFGFGVAGGVNLFALRHFSFLIEVGVEPSFGSDSTTIIPILTLFGIRGNV